MRRMGVENAQGCKTNYRRFGAMAVNGERFTMQSRVSLAAALLGGFLHFLLCKDVHFGPIVLDAAASSWVALGIFAMVTGRLSLSGKVGPASNYVGNSARLYGAWILLSSVLLWAAVIYLRLR